MSLGIPLSQLINSNICPLTSGISSLDKALDNGFYRRSIYEIFGVPGIGKTQLAKQLVNNMLKMDGKDGNILWIDTNKTVNMRDQEWINNTSNDNDVSKNIFHVRIRKLSELIFYLQQLINSESELKYSLIVIDGFSQLLVNHLNVILNHGVDSKQLHDIKCKRLIVILTLLTKYAHSNNSIIILVDDCMNTSYQWENNELYSGIYNEDNLEILENGNNFFVSDKQSLLKRKNVQNLKSSLIANCAMGNKDGSWEIFFKARIGLYWDWTIKKDNFKSMLKKKNYKDRPKRCITAVINDSKSGSNQNKKKRYRTHSPLSRSISLTPSTSSLITSSPTSLINPNFFHHTLSDSQLTEDIEDGPIRFYYSNKENKFIMLSNTNNTTTITTTTTINNDDNYPNKRQMIDNPSQTTAVLSSEIHDLDDAIYDSQD